MIDQALLQAYRARLPKRAADAEFINSDVYASGPGDQATELEPQGLVDRLYRERFSAEPMIAPEDDPERLSQGTRLPTTKRAY